MTYTPLTPVVDAATDRGKMERIALSGSGTGTEETEWVHVTISVSGLVASSTGAASANTAAIQAALDFIEAAGGGIVVVPVGRYYINDTLALGSRCILAGHGWGTILTFADGTSTDAAHKDMVMAKGNTNYIGIRDIYLDGNSAGQTGDTTHGSNGVNFYARGTTEGVGAPTYDGGLWLSNVMAFNFKGSGFYCRGDSTTMRVHHCYAYHNTQAGFWGKTDCIFTDSVAGNNGWTGFYFYSGTSVILANLKSFGSGSNDFTIEYCNTVMLSNCQSEDFTFAGFYLNALGHLTMVGCQVYRSKGTDALRSAYWLQDDAAGNNPRHVMMRGCTVLGGGTGGVNYALTTRNLAGYVDIDLQTETIAVADRNHLSGTDQGRIVINGAVVLDTITTQRINFQTGTTYTPVLTDINGLVKQTNAGAITTTLPQDSALAVPVGAHIDFAQGGAGQVTFVAGTGATVHGYPGLKIAGQYGVASAFKESANTWLVTGALSA